MGSRPQTGERREARQAHDRADSRGSEASRSWTRRSVDGIEWLDGAGGVGPYWRQAKGKEAQIAQSNIEVVRSYIDAVGRFDLETAARLVADDLVMHIPGRNPMSGEIRGRDGLIGMFEGTRDLAGGQMPVPKEHDITSSEDHVVALLSRTIAGVEARAAVVYHVMDRKITEMWPHELNQYALDEAVSGGGAQQSG
jgi:ketosteroid isomerase-like protein